MPGCYACGGADFGDKGMLVVIVYLDIGAVRRRAFGVETEVVPVMRPRTVLVIDRDGGDFAAGFNRVDRAVFDQLFRLDAGVQGVGEVAVTHDVAERGRARSLRR